MPDARITEICDAVVTYLTANMTGSPTIARVYLPDFDKKDFTGPAVYVFGASYNQAEMLDRANDIDGYVVSVVFAEKCTDAGLPSKAWIDARVSRVEQEIYNPLQDHRTPALSGLWPQSAEVASVYDYDFLRLNLFVSECVFEFREVD